VLEPANLGGCSLRTITAILDIGNWKWAWITSVSFI